MRRQDGAGVRELRAGPIAAYQIKDGAIICPRRGGGTIYTKEIYADFVVRLEFKMPRGGNNGLAIRYPGRGDPAYVGMCELQVLDNSAKGYAKLDPRQYHGSAYGMVAAHRGYQRPLGEWNYQQVTVRGSKIRVELNGTTILDTDLGKVTKYFPITGRHIIEHIEVSNYPGKPQSYKRDTSQELPRIHTHLNLRIYEGKQ